MENGNAEMQTTHIVASGMSTIALSGSGPTTDLAGSVSDVNGFTATASRSHIRCILDEMTEEHASQLVADFTALWKERIVEEQEPGIYRISARRSSRDGSTGPSPEEAEPCAL